MSLDPSESVRIAGDLDGELHGWYEELSLGEAEPLAAYATGPFVGTAAIAERALGEGTAIYLAGVADGPTLSRLYRMLCSRVALRLLELPADVEAVPLTSPEADLIVLLNHSGEERAVELGAGTWRAHLGTVSGDRIVLDPLGVALVASERSSRSQAPAVA
jgi:beta-galactosidase